MPAELTAAVAKIEPAFKASVEKRPGCEKAIVCGIYNQRLEPLWTTAIGKPGILPKIAKSKARSCLSGKEMKDPRGCTLVCCHVMPWMCGCSGHMAVQGAVTYQLAGTDAACLVVSGAPAGATDLEIVNEIVAALGAGGAPVTGATMAR